MWLRAARPYGAFLFADEILGGFYCSAHAAVLCGGDQVDSDELDCSDVLTATECGISGAADLVKAVFV